MKFNEDSRVKIPSILHLIRLGFNYLSLKDQAWDEQTNVFTDIFEESLLRINPGVELKDIKRCYDKISLELENEDLGKAFYNRLTSSADIRLVDFNNFENNSLHVVTELTCKNGDEEFRPDITLLVNGMPLVFIEVKKPNNHEGILAEHKRIQTRFRNKKFRKFANITQLMIFSNNMPYDDNSIQPIAGAFYATPSYNTIKFNYFREEETFNLSELLRPDSDEIENIVLKDNNMVGIKNSPEFITNKNPESPTNKICNSLLQPNRLAFMLQYSIAYVKESTGLQKHIMRYPQMFATKAIEKKLDEGIRKGIIWHTQGSGKTALTFYNVKYLTHYFQKKGIVPKFYFIVDRLDLLTQASKEFKSRGLTVHEIASREAFARDIKSTSAIHNDSGKPEITVVNIHKFEDDPNVVRNSDYNVHIQRIYFLDEVHRSYNPEGSFLANLHESDKNAIKIGLTGTPLIGATYNSKQIFGDYIHKYYYNKSIADGYTLRLIREEIETTYSLKLKEILDSIKILKGHGKKEDVYAHHRFVEPMLDYIIKDLEQARFSFDDNSMGAMVVCDSSKQANALFEVFQSKYAISNNAVSDQILAAEPYPNYGNKIKKLSKITRVAVVLHDVGDRKESVELFKDGHIDILFVFNMLLTGFDAPRLKKIYLARVIKSHNLLQTLTRVNRTYKNHKYGYVVDFADIQSEFDKTNADYFKELQLELGDEYELYTNLFKKPEEIEAEIREIKEVLFHFNINNAEVFTQQINEINDHAEMLKITKALNNAKSLYNIIRMSGNYDILNQLDFYKLSVLARDANNRLAFINTRTALEKGVDTTNLLNVALEDVIFAFTKIKEEEMVLADQLKDILQKTRELLGGNFDQKAPEFISLKEELERLFKKKNLSEVTKEEMEANIKALELIYAKAKELERKNNLLKAKYNHDEKYARLHKRLMEKDPLTKSESELFEALNSLKQEIDAQILQNSKMLENENFVEKMMLRIVIDQLKNKHHLQLDAATSKRINSMVVKEYLNEFYGSVA